MPDQPELTPAQTAFIRQRVQELPGSPVVVLVPAATGRQTFWWALTVLLAVVTTALLTRSEFQLVPGAWAQNAAAAPGGVGARGIYAFTGQLTAKTYGLFMMDVDSGTIWCYELEHGPNGEPQMKLVAARSWIYDRFLEEFNVADPVPSAVKMLVQQQRAGQPAQAGGGAANTPVPGPAANTTGLPVLPAPEGRE